MTKPEIVFIDRKRNVMDDVPYDDEDVPYISITSLRAFLEDELQNLEKEIFDSQIEASKPIAVRHNIDIDLRRQQQIMAIVRDGFYKTLQWLQPDEVE